MTFDVHLEHIKTELATGNERVSRAAFTQAHPGQAQFLDYAPADLRRGAQNALHQFPLEQAKKYPTVAYLFHYGAPPDKIQSRAKLGLLPKPPETQSIQASIEHASST